MIYISLTKIKVPLIPGLIHWNLAWIMESHRIISCHWSNYCFETHHGQESSERGLLISQASGCFSMFFPVAPDLSQSFLCVLENWRPSAASAVKGIALVQRMGWGWMGWVERMQILRGKSLLPRFAPFGFWITRTSSISMGCTDFLAGSNDQTRSGRQEMLNFAKHTGFEGHRFLERASLVPFPCGSGSGAGLCLYSCTNPPLEDVFEM